MAHSEIVLASRLAHRPAPIDGVTTAIDDLDVVAAEAARARRLGFGGKLCIHPSQIDPVNRALPPTAEELAWAERVLAAARGTGAARIGGQMVDAPVIKRAQSILDRAVTSR